MAFERIFNNNPIGILGSQSLYEVQQDGSGDDAANAYEAIIRALIADAVDYEESDLRPDREENINYFYGYEPRLDGKPNREYIEGDPLPPDDEDMSQRSSVVSTDVRDTVMAIMPSLVRIFMGSEHAVEYRANYPEQEEAAKQATDYIRYKFWDENEGFRNLHDVLMDCLTNRVGILTWWSDRIDHVQVSEYSNITMEQRQTLIGEQEGVEILEEVFSPVNPNIVDYIKLRYQSSKPCLRIEAVPQEEFRISRRARRIHSADLIGREQILRASDVVKLGYSPDLVYEYTGASYDVSEETTIRDTGGDLYHVVNDLVRYGDYYIWVDSDGDGINELHRICTLGDSFDIIADDIVGRANYALFSPALRPHSLIGDAIADLVKDIQDINSNLYRGSLDSLAQSIFPRTVINELLTNVDDALNDDIGAVIRTRGDPQTAVHAHTTPFVGGEAFGMIQQLQVMRQQRTGITEASKGIDPRALQSTNVVGIDAILTGAQERIELIARILAETGFKELYQGLLYEVVNNPNPQEVVEIRGKWVPVDPSLFDPNMRVRVNPSLGKGTDQARLMVLQEVKNTQMMIIDKFGVNNPVCGVEEFRNTIDDILAIGNIQATDRYFRKITPEIKQQIEQAPKEPDPQLLLAQAEMEKSKKDVVIATGKQSLDERKLQMDDDFRRDELNVNSFLEILGVLKDAAVADTDTDQYVEPRNQQP